MSNIALLNNIDHIDLRVHDVHGAEFGDNVNQALIFPTEFEEAQREYPILFRRKEDGSYAAVVLLGLELDENLFLDGSRWTSPYVPAVHRRGPFSIGVNRREPGGDVGEPMIHVDLDDQRVSRDAGQSLFLAQGGSSPHLDRVAAVLRAIHVGREVAGPMFAAFDEAGLIEPVTIEVDTDGRRYSIPDAFTISAERLAALRGPALEALHQNGFLRAAFAVAMSLANVGRLIERKRSREAAEEQQR